uniref:WD_REPEATS_REGION domain-containing protein n=2 Tax=Mesocestoides corti TaxID=53468 RepID=A0A5K3FFX4_MESCO
CGVFESHWRRVFRIISPIKSFPLFALCTLQENFTPVMEVDNATQPNVDGANDKNVVTAPVEAKFDSKKIDCKNGDRNLPNDLRLSTMVLPELLNAFLCNGGASESVVDEALTLMRLSTTALVSVDESYVVAALLRAIEKADENVSSKYLLLISSLLSYTFSPRSLRLIIEYLMPFDQTWRPYSYELLHQLKIASSFPNNMSFFVFPGTSKSTLAIPPISKFPYQNGWSFHCWVYLDPSLCKLSDAKPRYLFCFQTNKGTGYTAHFLGSLLIITSITSKGKDLQHCVLTEFYPCRWYMLVIAFVYNRWSKCEIRCYVDGNIVSNSEMAWPIATSDSFDKCVIGGLPDQREENLFFGRIASIMGFTEALLPHQIAALYALGPNYKGQLRFESEVKGLLSDTERKALFESRLASSLMFAYHPSACDHNLCLDQSPKLNATVFAHSPHGLMQGEIRPVRTTSLQSALHSLGGIQLLYLLFDQLDYTPEGATGCEQSHCTVEPFPVAALLFNLVFDLVRTSATLRRQFARTNGLLVFAQALWKSSPVHLCETLLNGILEATRYLTREILAISATTSHADKASRPALATLSTLFRQIFDKLLFAHNLWLRAPIKVQDRLYSFLADEFRVDLLGQPGKTIVATTLHAIKYCFWIVKPTETVVSTSPNSSPAERPPAKYLARIRSNLLFFIKPLIVQQHQPTSTSLVSTGEELDSLLNYLSTVKEPDNLRDVLYFTVVLMSQYPAVMVPWFDKHDGIQCVFQLLALDDEESRLYALKLLGYFLKYSKEKRKQESIGQYSVFSLLCDRFAVVSPAFTMKAYNVFFELLTEDVTLQLTSEMLPKPSPTHRIENPALLKTIALLIIHSKRTSELMNVRQIFLEHLLFLCLSSDANRRAILQMSVWQDWVIGLASLYPVNRQNSYATATVMEILRCLLYYALRFEYGGWRVWIDTLAILHSRIAFEEFRRSSHQARLANNHMSAPPKPTNGRENQGVVVSSDAASSEVGDSMATTTVDGGEAANGTYENMTPVESAVRELIEDLLDKLVHEIDNSERRNENVAPAAGDGMDVDQSKHNVASLNPHRPRRVAQKTERVPVAFRTPPFAWSYLHQILLDSVLRSIEDEFHNVATLYKPTKGSDGNTAATSRRSPETESLNDDSGECDISAENLHHFINELGNQVYAINLIHLISQLSDSLITACGGLLPLLAAATSPSMELELQDSASGLSLEAAFGFLLRVTNIADVVVLSTSVNLGSLEKETGMNSGGIIRQFLRLACTCAVRNCLEARLYDFLPLPDVQAQLRGQSRRLSFLPVTAAVDAATSSTAASKPQTDPLSVFHFFGLLRHKLELIQRLANPVTLPSSVSPPTTEVAEFLEHLDPLAPCLQKLVIGLRPSVSHYASGFMGGIFDRTVVNPLLNFVSLLQNVDINRLHNVIYKDEEDTRQVHFIVLAVTYFLSVLMVSKYRDLLDPSNFLKLCHRRTSSKVVSGSDSVDGCSNQPASPPSSKYSHVASPATASRNDAQSAEDSRSQEASPEEPATEIKSTSSQPEDIHEATEPNSSASVIEVPAANESAEFEKANQSEDTREATEPRSSASVIEEPTASESAEVEDVREVSVEENAKSTEQEGQAISSVHQDAPEPNLSVSPPTEEPAVCSVVGGSSLRASTKVEEEETAATTPALAGSDLEEPPTTTDLPEVIPKGSTIEPYTSGTDLTEHLEMALGTVTPLLKEIFFDFAPFLSKTLIGSHGQELLSGGLTSLRTSSMAVELVMLLCSQEWQNSLQKHAGLAFIELVNECRLLAKASRDHFNSVAHEADFILGRLRTLDLSRHANFKHASSRRQVQRVLEFDSHQARRLEAAHNCDDVFAAHCLTLANHLVKCIQEAPPLLRRCEEKSVAALQNHTRLFLERTKRPSKRIFYRLDSWEDDSRRRRRLVINPFGSTHPEAVLHSPPQASNTSHSTDALPAPLLIDSKALNLHSQEDNADDARRVSEDSLPPLTPTATSPFAINEPGLVPGLVSLHRDVFTFGQLEFDASNPVVVTTPCQLIAAGVAVHGTLSVTGTYFSFKTDPTHEENRTIDPEVLAYTGNLYSKWPFTDIRAVFTRRHLLQNVALEIFLTNRSSVMFALSDHTTVAKVVYALPPVGIGVRYGVPQSHRVSLSVGRQHFTLSHITQRWQRREMSNFDYLMYLNTIAGRSFNDLNQYPIFPWVLSNYTSDKLDLNEPANYRDLSKPIGALDPTRKAFFDQRYAEWDDETQPPFHYGTHYSTAAFVLNYLIRLEPFTTLFLNMQGGKFDHPNRLFYSIEAAWSGCMRSSTNVKELIPEFFYLPEMFVNTNDYDLGSLEDKTKLGDVVLPPWASSPEEFVRIHRQALESDLVSCQLHHWIDLIFGYKQRGPEAVKATNVFHHLTYEGSINWDQVTDPILRKAIENQIQSFGQTPSQLLTTPHPQRSSALGSCPSLFNPLTQEVCCRLKLPSNSPIVAIFSNTHPCVPSPAVVAVSANRVFTVNKWNRSAADLKLAPTPASPTTSGAARKTSSSSSSVEPPQSLSFFPVPAPLPSSSTDNQPAAPLVLDTTPLVPNPSANRRYVGENIDPSLCLTSNNFVVTADNRAIAACGYFDYSFRIFSVESGRCVQSVYGHQDVVTCLGISESNSSPHCYIASGGRDGLVLLWILNSKTICLFSEYAGELPLPQATLAGHQEPLQCIGISAELGLVFSGSEGGC